MVSSCSGRMCERVGLTRSLEDDLAGSKSRQASQACLTRGAPEFVELPGFGRARDIPTDRFALLPDPLALHLPGGFLCDLAQQRRETDVTRVRLGREGFPNLVIEPDRNRSSHGGAFE